MLNKQKIIETFQNKKNRMLLILPSLIIWGGSFLINYILFVLDSNNKSLILVLSWLCWISGIILTIKLAFLLFYVDKPRPSKKR